jgi:hypothetical protein
MRSEIHYDHDGCHGQLITMRRSSWPSRIGWVLLLALIAVLAGAFALHPLLPFGVLAIGLAAVLGQAREDDGRVRTGADDEPPTFEWLFAVRPHVTPFSVDGEVLVVGSGIEEVAVPLAGATIRSSHGVFVSPVWGEPVGLYWVDDAIDADAFADALRRVAAREDDSGSASEVPRALEELTR